MKEMRCQLLTSDNDLLLGGTNTGIIEFDLATGTEVKLVSLILKKSFYFPILHKKMILRTFKPVHIGFNFSVLMMNK